MRRKLKRPAVPDYSGSQFLAVPVEHKNKIMMVPADIAAEHQVEAGDVVIDAETFDRIRKDRGWREWAWGEIMRMAYVDPPVLAKEGEGEAA